MIPSFLLRSAFKKSDSLSKIGPIFLISNPKHVEEVLVSKAQDFGKGGGMWDAIRPLLGEGLITAEGDSWRKQRRHAQPFFTKSAIEKLMSEMKQLAEEECDRIEFQMKQNHSGVINLADEMRHIAQRLLLRLLFGSNHPPDLGTHLQTALSVMNRRLFLYFLPSWLIPGNKRFNHAIAAIDERVTSLTSSFLTGATSVESSQSPSEQTMKQDEYSKKEQRDQLVTLYVAGSDTVASAMTWMGCMFAKHPESQEMDIHLVARETLRLYPPIWFFPRFASQDTEVGGQKIKKGKVLILCPLATQRDPRFWERPMDFDPMRIHPEERLAYYPFGAGARKCIGEYLALVEMQTVMNVMKERFYFEWVPQTNLALSSATTLWPKRPLLQLRKRSTLSSGLSSGSKL